MPDHMMYIYVHTINDMEYFCRKLKICENSRAKPNHPNDHIYNELDMYTMFNAKTATSAKTPSPKSDKVIFDTIGIEPHQSLPVPCYESCSATSIAKSNHSNDYHIEEDATVGVLKMKIVNVYLRKSKNRNIKRTPKIVNDTAS